MLDEFYRIAFCKKVYATIDELQACANQMFSRGLGVQCAHASAFLVSLASLELGGILLQLPVGGGRAEPGFRCG